MHNQLYVGPIALCTRKKLLKSGEIRYSYGIAMFMITSRCVNMDLVRVGCSIVTRVMHYIDEHILDAMVQFIYTSMEFLASAVARVSAALGGS